MKVTAKSKVIIGFAVGITLLVCGIGFVLSGTTLGWLLVVLGIANIVGGAVWLGKVKRLRKEIAAENNSP